MLSTLPRSCFGPFHTSLQVGSSFHTDLLLRQLSLHFPVLEGEKEPLPFFLSFQSPCSAPTWGRSANR
jgi:hypothetical protein